MSQPLEEAMCTGICTKPSSFTPHPRARVRETTEHPAVIEDNDAPLLSSLTRHVNLGLNSDDVSALISSIASGQEPQSHASSYPHLPAEVLLNILEFIPIDYILEWRLVCRGFRNAIDERILFQYLKRAELIGFLGNYIMIPPFERLNSKDYEQICYVRTRFERVEDSVEVEGGKETIANWSGTHAIFRIEDQWCNDFESIRVRTSEGHYAMRVGWNRTCRELRLDHVKRSFGSPRWCIRLDHAVWDLEFPVEVLRGKMEVDLSNRRVRLEWKDLLFRVLKTETTFRKMFEKRKHPPYTWCQSCDCLLAVRRQRLRATLDLNKDTDRELDREMNNLCLLFGEPQREGSSELDSNSKMYEEKALSVYVILRNEVTMSSKERAYLKNLAKDREAMQKQLYYLDQAVKALKGNLFMKDLAIPNPREMLPSVPLDPLAWSYEVWAREEERIEKWRTEKKTIDKIILMIIIGSDRSIPIPRDALDALGIDLE